MASSFSPHHHRTRSVFDAVEPALTRFGFYEEAADRYGGPKDVKLHDSGSICRQLVQSTRSKASRLMESAPHWLKLASGDAASKFESGRHNDIIVIIVIIII